MITFQHAVTGYRLTHTHTGGQQVPSASCYFTGHLWCNCVFWPAECSSRFMYLWMCVLERILLAHWQCVCSWFRSLYICTSVIMYLCFSLSAVCVCSCKVVFLRTSLSLTPSEWGRFSQSLHLYSAVWGLRIRVRHLAEMVSARDLGLHYTNEGPHKDRNKRSRKESKRRQQEIKSQKAETRQERI